MNEIYERHQHQPDEKCLEQNSFDEFSEVNRMTDHRMNEIICSKGTEAANSQDEVDTLECHQEDDIVSNEIQVQKHKPCQLINPSEVIELNHIVKTHKKNLDLDMDLSTASFVNNEEQMSQVKPETESQALQCPEFSSEAISTENPSKNENSLENAGEVSDRAVVIDRSMGNSEFSSVDTFDSNKQARAAVECPSPRTENAIPTSESVPTTQCILSDDSSANENIDGHSILINDLLMNPKTSSSNDHSSINLDLSSLSTAVKRRNSTEMSEPVVKKPKESLDDAEKIPTNENGEGNNGEFRRFIQVPNVFHSQFF